MFADVRYSVPELARANVGIGSRAPKNPRSTDGDESVCIA